MWSKNKAAMTKAERQHVTRIKLMPCCVCGDGGGESAPSEAHELEQGQWFTSIPLCASCHRDPFNGVHGQKRMWSVLKKTEMTCLNELIGELVK